MEKLKVTLKKSLITEKPNTKLTAQSLGLKRIGDFIIHDDTPALAGKIRVLHHLVSVEKA